MFVGDAVLLLARIVFDLFALCVLVIFVVPCRLGRAVGLLRARPRKEFRSILITGASAGIGEGLALQYATPGTRLFLVALQEPSLQKVASACKALGAEVQATYLDVSDKVLMETLIDGIDASSPLDLVVANAGIVGGDDDACVRTNFLGLIHTLTPATKHMKRRGSGQLVIMSSLGGHAPTTNRYMTAYNATKAAANSYGLGLRACLAAEGIGVTVVCPGFVRSRMTDGLAKQGVRFYGLWETERACAVIKEGVSLNEPEVAFPMALNVITRLLGAMPPWLKEIALPTLISGDPFVVMDKAKKL